MLYALIFAALLNITPIANDESLAFEVYEFAMGQEVHLWPGFEPRKYPVAIFDGKTTYLFNHPAPPEEFKEASGESNYSVFVGRYPAVSANSSIDIGGTVTATLMLGDMGDRPLSKIAAVLVHECFHVFQKEAYPTWGANEASAFTYPFNSVENYRLSLLERIALLNAIKSTTKDKLRVGWIRKALSIRKRRYLKMGEADRLYEQNTELHEGTARYVQSSFEGEKNSESELLGYYQPQKVRQKSYGIGCAFAQLLDWSKPDWKKSIDSDESFTLDGMLLESIKGMKAAVVDFDTESLASISSAAKQNVEVFLASIEKMEKKFNDIAGVTVILEIRNANPLWPAGFDPLNVTNLGGGKIMHHRFLKLQNQTVSLSSLNLKAITTAMGEKHPLFNGVRGAVFKGFEKEPTIIEEDGSITVSYQDFEIVAKKAKLEKDGSVIKIIVE